MSIKEVLANKIDWFVAGGDARQTLSSIPDETIHCVVTSPPFYKLRDYATEPQIWGGTPTCDHAFSDVITKSETTGINKRQPNSSNGKKPRQRSHKSSGQICFKCGAWKGELGSEEIPDCLGWAQPDRSNCGRCYICHLREIFGQVFRVLRKDGIAFVNLGDSYSANGRSLTNVNDPNCLQATNLGTVRPGRKTPGIKPKNLIGIPWRFALAMQADGWYLRSECIEEVEFYCPCGCGEILEERIWRYDQDREIIWKKPSTMPESVKDRPTRSHEQVFVLTRSRQYFYDYVAVKTPAKQSSIERMQRGVSSGHKNINGAPGQTPHTINQPRENLNLVSKTESLSSSHGQGKRSGGQIIDAPKLPGFDVDEERVEKGQKKWDSSMAGGAIGIKERKSRDSSGGAYVTANLRSVVTIANTGYKGDHFATYPIGLVEILVKAGTSQHGVCPNCAKQWVRVEKKHYELNLDRPQTRRAVELFEESRLTKKHLDAIRSYGLADTKRSAQKMNGANSNRGIIKRLAEEAKTALGGYYREFLFGQSITIGFRPDCNCYDDLYRSDFQRTKDTGKLTRQEEKKTWLKRAKRRPGLDKWPVRPAVVLDIFSGMATTGVTALELRRRYLGSELNSDYLELSRKRISDSRSSQIAVSQ